eukprot:scaffold48560_cov61-Phaeocystis_antarctica.AAC.3
MRRGVGAARVKRSRARASAHLQQRCGGASYPQRDGHRQDAKLDVPRLHLRLERYGHLDFLARLRPFQAALADATGSSLVQPLVYPLKKIVVDCGGRARAASGPMQQPICEQREAGR